MAIYEQVHAGDIVLGHDGDLWGVKEITHVPQIAVTLVKNGLIVTGYPPAGTPVTVVSPADLSAEFEAAQMFIDAGLGVEVVHERV
jgi:hypothetical protein